MNLTSKHTELTLVPIFGSQNYPKFIESNDYILLVAQPSPYSVSHDAFSSRSACCVAFSDRDPCPVPSVWNPFDLVFSHRVKNRTCSRAHFRKLEWGGVGIIPTVSMATLHDLHLHFHDLRLHFMLRYLIFTCTFIDGVGWGGDNTNHVYGYPTWSSLALHATLLDFR